MLEALTNYCVHLQI